VVKVTSHQSTALAGALLASLLLAACQVPPPALKRDETPRPSVDWTEVPGAETSTIAPLAPGVLRVRLTAAEGSPALEVRGSARGPLSFRREGDRVRASSGEIAPSFELLPAPGADGLSVADRTYPGSLRIAPDALGGLMVENLVDLEDYVAGVVPAELILWSAEVPEIEAQAVAARTYALRSLATRTVFAERAFVWDDTRDQVYLGRFTLEQGNDLSASERKVLTRLATGLGRSRAQVLVDPHGKLYDVRFHASCGGTTTSPAEAFPLESTLHHEPVTCEPCREIGATERGWSSRDTRRRRVHWRWTASAEELAQLARRLALGENLTHLGAPRSDAHGRWQSVEIGGQRGRTRISIERLRGELGAADLKSGLVLDTWPELGTPISGGLYLEGLGRGHGAGLCQVGSHEYARRGWGAREILGHYFPTSRRVELPADRPLEANYK
jgi:SpoIID/LytB domain protein